MSEYRGTEGEIGFALQGLENGRFASIADAARAHGVPYDRLHARASGVSSRSERAPTNRLLTDEQEIGLCKWIEVLDKLGTRATKAMVETAAAQGQSTIVG